MKERYTLRREVGVACCTVTSEMSGVSFQQKSGRLWSLAQFPRATVKMGFACGGGWRREEREPLSQHLLLVEGRKDRR